MTTSRRRKVALFPEATRGWLDGTHLGADATLAPLEDADGLVWTSDDPAGLSEALTLRPGLRWVHLPVAGIDRFRDVIDDQRIWTCAKGANAEPVAEHALALMLALSRQILPFARSRSWQSRECQSLRGARVLVVGAGAVARALIELLRPFGSECVVVGVTPRAFDGATWLPVEQLDAELPVADFLVLAAAATAATDGLIDSRRLELLRPTAHLINVGRGSLVDHAALRIALADGQIAGAGLDVTDPEPLEDDDPLLQDPRCLVTSHSAAAGREGAELLRRRARANLVRFVEGRPLLGRIQPEKGY